MVVFCFPPPPPPYPAESLMILLLCFKLLLTGTDSTSSPLWSLFVSAVLVCMAYLLIKITHLQIKVGVTATAHLHENWTLSHINGSSGTFWFYSQQTYMTLAGSRTSPHRLHPMRTCILTKSVCSACLCMRAASIPKETEGMVPTLLTAM